MRNQINLKFKFLFVLLTSLLTAYSAIGGLLTALHADTHTALSCSKADIDAAISLASAGDTVNVPSGTCRWPTTLTLTKHISLIGGHDGGTTLIYGDGDPIIWVAPDDDVTDTLQRVSGFTFDGESSKTRIMNLGDIIATPGFAMLTRVRVDHCIFQNSVNYTIWNFCTVYGVVDNCRFGPVGPAAYTFWSNIWGSDPWYNTPPQMYWQPGSEKSVYFEDNIIYVKDGGRVVCHNFAGRGVYRYNTIIHLGACQGDFELHGHQGGCDSSAMPATFGVEIYGNRISGSTGSSIYEGRGGSSMVFWNTMIGATPGHHSYWGNFSCPCIAPEEQVIHDTYLWNNRRDYTGAVAGLFNEPGTTVCAGHGNRPVAGVDIFNESQTSPGITQGTLASLPGTCVVGQGYWATSQPTGDLTNYVGDINTNPTRRTIQGTFYKCTATNTWEKFYTPFPYHHPLIGESSDTTPPGTPANVRDGTSSSMDGRWTYSQTTLSANWDASADAESGISGYKYAIGTSQGATNITNGWLTNGTNLAVTKTGLTLTAGVTYYFSVKAVNGAGLESSSSNSDGQYSVRYGIDTTGPVMGSVRDGAGADIAVTTLNTQLSANWDSATDAETGVNMYSYAIGTTAGGSNIRGWTDAGANLNVTATGIGLTYGATYYFSVKAQNTDGYWGGTANSNGQRLVDTTPPSAPSEVRDGAITGADIDVTFSTTALRANWSAAADDESGISGYEYAIGTTPGATNITNGWITNYTNTVVTRTGLNLTVGATYYFRVRAVNGEGLPGSPASSDGQYVSKIATIDTTPPANIAQVRDGTAGGVDISYTASATGLSANWDASVDNESEVTRYRYAIGTSPGATNVVGWTDNGAPVSVTRTGLVLTVGATYYFSVKAENGVGLQSGVKNSNGQCVVASGTQIPPVISNVKAVNITANSVTITWDTDKAVTSQVEYGLTVVYGKMTIENSYFVTAHNVVIMGLAAGTTYHYRAISMDIDGNQAISPDYTFSTLPAPNKVTDVNAYPNPVDFSGGQQVKFLVKGGEGREVSIYTIRARLVRKIIVKAGTEEALWDGTDKDGEKVTRGIYIYSIIQDNGDKITGKIAVIKSN